MRKRVIPLLAMFLMLALMPVNVAAHTADEPFVTDLIADGGDEAVDVGDIRVWNDGAYLYVEYVMDGGWTILKTHLHVADSLGGIRQTGSGNPIPGLFEYYSTELFDDGVTEKLYEIPLGWDYGKEIYIAAHAIVVSTSEKMTIWDFSEPGVAAFGPAGLYYGLDDPLWGSSNPAVATWVYPDWPSIPDATWISTAYYVEDPVSDSWRKFHKEIDLPEKGCYLTGSVVLATSDNAEEIYFNGELVGSDGEVQGTFIGNHEWETVIEYPVIPVPGTNSMDFIVRNYAQAGGSTISNPTGLIYSAYFDCYRMETAWGDGFEFDGKNWATYVAYTIQEPYKFWNLPDDPAGIKIYAHPGTSNTYFDMLLWDVGPGFDISDGVWPAWCVDSDIYIYYRDYTATVYSSYDPNLPPWASDEEWDYINYILNHKHSEAAMMDIQQAIWYFADDEYPMPTDPEAVAMVNDALANGDGFKPVAGQIGAVILAIGDDVQLIFIEVDP